MTADRPAVIDRRSQTGGHRPAVTDRRSQTGGHRPAVTDRRYSLFGADTVELGLDNGLVTLGANAVAEGSFCALCDVLFDPDPNGVIISDFLAIHAGWQNTFEPPDMFLESNDPLGDHQAGSQFLRIVRFCNKIIGAG